MDNPVLVQAERASTQVLSRISGRSDRYLRSPGRVIVSLTPAGDEVEELSELVGGVAAVRPGTTWVGNPTAELADYDGGAVDSATAVERTKGLSTVVGAAGSHLAGFDIEFTPRGWRKLRWCWLRSGTTGERHLHQHRPPAGGGWRRAPCSWWAAPGRDRTLRVAEHLGPMAPLGERNPEPHRHRRHRSGRRIQLPPCARAARAVKAVHLQRGR